MFGELEGTDGPRQMQIHHRYFKSPTLDNGDLISVPREAFLNEKVRIKKGDPLVGVIIHASDKLGKAIMDAEVLNANDNCYEDIEDEYL